MLRAALRDLQWRRRRFAIALAGTALVFAMTLVLTGISHGFTTETDRLMDQLDVDTWVVREGAAGPFLGAAPLPAAVAGQIGELPGVEQAEPFAFGRATIDKGDGVDEVLVFGAPPSGLVLPDASEGRAPRRPGEVAVSTALAGYDVGDEIVLSGRRFAVVGEVPRSTALAGSPNVFVTLSDGQALAFAGQPIASAVAVAGTLPDRSLPGLEAMDEQAASEDLRRPLAQARSGIALTAVLLWIVAATIIGSIVYLSALERQRDFAVFKATGVATRSILAGLALQAVILSVGAALVGSAIATLLAPVFPLPVSIAGAAHLLLPGIAVAVGLIASLAGLRRAVAVEPALAFGGP